MLARLKARLTTMSWIRWLDTPCGLFTSGLSTQCFFLLATSLTNFSSLISPMSCGRTRTPKPSALAISISAAVMSRSARSVAHASAITSA